MANYEERAGMQYLALQAETTRGTYNAPTSGDLYGIEGLEWTPEPQTRVARTERNGLTPGIDDQVPGDIFYTVTFRVPLVVRAPAAGLNYMTIGATYAPFATMAGMKGDNQTTYYDLIPDSAHATGENGYSAIVWRDGKSIALRGCACGMDIVCDYENGESHLACTMRGIYVSSTEESAIAAVPDITYYKQYPGGATCTLTDGSTTASIKARRWTIALNNAPVPYYASSASKGALYFHCPTMRNYVLTLTHSKPYTGSTDLRAEFDAWLAAHTRLVFGVTATNQDIVGWNFGGQLTGVTYEQSDAGLTLYNSTLVGNSVAVYVDGSEFYIRFKNA